MITENGILLHGILNVDSTHLVRKADGTFVLVSRNRYARKVYLSEIRIAGITDEDFQKMAETKHKLSCTSKKDTPVLYEIRRQAREYVKAEKQRKADERMARAMIKAARTKARMLKKQGIVIKIKKQ